MIQTMIDSLIYGSKRATKAKALAKTAEAKWAANTPCPTCGAYCLKASPKTLTRAGLVRCNWCKWEIKGTLCPSST